MGGLLKPQPTHPGKNLWSRPPPPPPIALAHFLDIIVYRGVLGVRTLLGDPTKEGEKTSRVCAPMHHVLVV